MHRNRTWTLDPPEWRTQRNRLLPIEGGDGSTLNLDFTKGVLDPRITFSRLSTATFVNSSGYVEYAGANLLLQGSNLGNATNWFGNGLTSRNPSTDPNGLNEAVELNEDVTNTVHCVIQVTSQNLNGLVYTSTVYMKAGTNRTIGFIRDNNVSSDAVVFYTLTGSGSTNIANGSYGISASISSVGAGWYRCVFTIKAISTANVTIGTAKGTAYGDWSFAGTVGNSIHVWGAQLNLGSTAQTYYPTTTAAYHAPRFDYSPTNIGEPRGLLIEGTSKNHLNFSNNFANLPWTAGTGASNDVVLTTANTLETLSPAGLNNAAKITKPVPPSGNGYGFIRQTSINLGPPAGPRTISIWVKQPSSNAARYFGLRATGDGFAPAISSRHATFDLQTGTVVANDGTNLYTNVSIVPYRDGWYRLSATTPSMAGEVPAGLIVASYSIVRPEDGEENNSQSGAVYIWGPQLEIGTGASSYIPTGASTVTRNVDVCSITGNNFTSVFGDGSIGTIVCSHEFPRSNGGLAHQPTPWSIGNYQAANARGYSYGSYVFGVGGYGWVYTPSSFGSATNSALSIAKNKCALAYNGLAITTALNGTTASSTGTGTSTISSATGLLIGYNATPRDFINACVSSIKVYPTAFTAAQLKIITDPDYVAPTFNVDFTSLSTGADLTAKGLTFNRLSPATFIDSNGFVEWAASNQMTYSQGQDSNSFWNAYGTNVVRTSLQTDPNGGTAAVKLMFDATATDAVISRTVALNNGLPYTISMWMRADSGTLTNVRFARGATPVGAFFPTLTTTWQRVSLSFIASGSADGIEIRVLNAGSPKTATFHVYGAQLESGSTVRAYQPAIGAAAYHAPRFDNTVLTSRTNLILQSNSFTVTPTWGQKNGTHAVTLTAGYEAAPPGFSGTATRITSLNTNAGLTQPLNVSDVSGKQILISFYGKSNKTSTQNCALQFSSGLISTISIPTTWTRIVVTGNSLTEVTLLGFLETLDVSIYGMQVEYVPTSSLVTDYIPTTTSPVTVNTTAVNGLLIEGQTTNDTFHSENITQGAWTVQAFPDSYPTVNITGGIAPNNTNTANVLTEGTGDWSRSIYQFKSGVAGTYTYSVWVKAISGNTRFVRLVLSSGAGDFVYVTVNMSTGAVTESAAARGTATAPSATVTPYPNSWYRIALTGTLAQAKSFIFLVPSNTGTFTVSTTDYGRISYVGTGAQFAVWGAQVEAGSGASSYIPTGASTVMRNADNCYIYDATTSGGLSWFKSPKEGTFFVEATKRFSGASFAGALFGTEVIATKDFMLYQAIGSNFLSLNWGTGEQISTYTALSSPFLLKTAVAFSTNIQVQTKADVLLSINGANSGGLNTNSNIALPFTTNIFCIGSKAAANATSPNQQYAETVIKRIAFYPTALTREQLNALTS